MLTRDDFPGKRLVDAVIDLPFALPTIVASLVMLALYGPASPVGVHISAHRVGRGVALLFVTLPFVVRAVQPVLLEMDREVEEAAASLGANNSMIVTRVMLPALTAGVVVRCGAGVLPGHRRIRLGGADRRCGARQHRGVLAVDPHPDRERRPAGGRRRVDRVADDLVRVLFVLRTFGLRAARREETAG